MSIRLPRMPRSKQLGTTIGHMSALQTGQMAAAETGQMPAAETGQMSAVEARLISKDFHNYPKTLTTLKTHRTILSATRS